MFPFYVSDALEFIFKARYKCLWVSHSTSGACGSLYGNHCSPVVASAMATVPKTVAHNSQTCSNATFIVVINHCTNLIGRMQSGLVHGPKDLWSTGLEEKSPGTPDRTTEKQNNCMDWFRIPNIPTTANTPLLFQSSGCLLCHSNQPQSSSFPNSTFSAPESFTFCQGYLGYPCDLSLKSNTTSSSKASNSAVSPWGSPSGHRPSLISFSPCCSHPHYTIHCPAEL